MIITDSGLRISEPFKTAKVKARGKRNAFSIHAYTGSNGGGKTMAAVFDALPALAAGRPVVSTCRILDPATGEPHPLWVPLDDFRMLAIGGGLGWCEVILDEVTGVASSRDSAGMPSAVLNNLQQLRKDDVTIRWTTPNWRRADTAIREVTQGLTTCVGLMPREDAVVSEDGLERRWKQRRLFVWRTYDAKMFDEWSATRERSTQKQHRLRPVARQAFWGPGHLVQSMYDTYEHALTLGVVSDAGMCMDCGGKRSPRRCSCPDHGAGADLLPLLAADGTCSACSRKRKASATCDCTPEVDHRPSLGMLRWREVDARRRRVLLPETDDTPSVVVETNAA